MGYISVLFYFTYLLTFAAAGPRLSNSLPADVRRTDVTVETFCLKLRTYLFGRDASK